MKETKKKLKATEVYGKPLSFKDFPAWATGALIIYMIGMCLFIYTRSHHG